MDNLLIELAQFHFLRPEWFFGIIPALLLFVLLWRRRSASGSWQKIVAPHLLPHLLQGNMAKTSRAPLFLILIAWMITLFALAGPTWKKIPQAVQKKIDAQVIVMDLSLSMFAQDVSPSRLERAKHKLSDILTKSKEGLTGLIVFAGSTHVVTPLTDDTRTILSMVDALSPDIMPIPGSAPAEAVIKAKEMLRQSGMNQGHIILLTDDLPANFTDKVKKELNTQDTPVSIFSIGTSEGSPIALPDGNFVKDSRGAIVIPKVNEGAMKTAAKQLGGRFTTLTYSDEDIDYLLGFKGSLLDQEMKDTERDFNTWDEAGHWLVLLIIPFAAAGYRKGWLGAFLIPFVLIGGLISPETAQANLWDDLWQTRDQQGQKAWRAEKYQEAADKFNDPMWKGSAQYRSEDYAGAEEEFAKFDTADGHYNRGNALAKQQRLEDAISAYEDALKHNPEMKDAKKNLELLKQLLQQQEQQGEDENKDGENQEQQESDQQNQQDQNQDQGDQEGESQQSEDQEKKDSEQQQSKAGESEEQKENQQNQSDQQQQEQKQQEQSEQNAQQDQNKEDGEKQEQQPARQQNQELEAPTEDQQALQQWLERVPDEPGGLLRRKFQMESKLRNRSKLESQAW